MTGLQLDIMMCVPVIAYFNNSFYTLPVHMSQGLYEADLSSDSVLRVFTSKSCIDYTVTLVDIVADLAGTYEREVRALCRLRAY
jgi:hypothetical protein